MADRAEAIDEGLRYIHDIAHGCRHLADLLKGHHSMRKVLLSDDSSDREKTEAAYVLALSEPNSREFALRLARAAERIAHGSNK